MTTPSPSPPVLLSPPFARECLARSTAIPTRGRGIDYGFVSTVDVEERQQGIRDVGYGIRDTWVDLAEAVPEIVPVTLGVNTRVTELAEVHEHDTQDLYALLEDVQDSRSACRFTYGGYDDSLGDSIDGGGGGLCFPRGLGSLDRIESVSTFEIQGTEGMVGLTQWIEKMESVFNISNCAIENQVKGNDVPAYTEFFQELTLICTKFVANETEKVDKYISGLPDNIYGNVKSARPKTLDETIELANDLMD
ncbi:hypothetical protein Tco_1163529 [Tanacetum coccineum]